MSRLTGRTRRADDDVEIDMVPIMNMFLVLIPFLLMSANFLHLKGINTSVPVQAESQPSAGTEARVTVVVQLAPDEIHLSALSDSVPGAELDILEERLPAAAADGYPWAALAGRLQAIKARYPRSDTMILIPHGGAQYGTVVRAMDVARRSGETLLFPNVVLSGKVG